MNKVKSTSLLSINQYNSLEEAESEEAAETRESDSE